jgi:hypothetical protein
MNFEDLKGMILSDISVLDDEIYYYTSCGRVFKSYHEQDCCEDVSVESVVGDVQDLIGEPILFAEVASNSKEDHDGSCTWTFYKLATRKGYVDIRWFGSSNGYYSEGVSFREIKNA